MLQLLCNLATLGFGHVLASQHWPGLGLRNWHWLQESLFSACMVEATALMNMLRNRVVSQTAHSPNSTWLALSAMVCFRRRIRSIVLCRSFARLLWDAHPAVDAYRLLDTLGWFMRELDASLLAAEAGIVQSVVDLLSSTMVASLLQAYTRRVRVGLTSSQCCASAALQHWRVSLRAMQHRCGPLELQGAGLWQQVSGLYA